jgi:hypothetical protein
VPAPARPLPIAERFSAALAGRLQELRWIEGRTVTIEYRWSEGRLERVAEIAAEFVRLKVDRRVWKRRRHVKASDGFHPHGAFALVCFWFAEAIEHGSRSGA